MNSLCVLTLLLAPASPPVVRVHVRQAALLPPAEDGPVGALSNGDVTPRAWRTPTRMAFSRRGPAMDVDSELELASESTEVEVAVSTSVVLEDAGGWPMVMGPDARLPLVAGDADGLTLGFLPEQSAPVEAVRLALPAVRAPAWPDATPEACHVSRMHQRADASSPSFEVSSVGWTVYAAGPVNAGWHPAWARGAGIAVSGFVADANVRCGVGTGGGFGVSGSSGASDGRVRARAATLPRGTRVWAPGNPQHILAVLHRSTPALQLEDGSWRIPLVTDGTASVSFHSVTVGAPRAPALAPLATHGVGSAYAFRVGWPRRLAAHAP